MTKIFHIILTVGFIAGTLFAEGEKRKGPPNKHGKSESESPTRLSIRKPLNSAKGTGKPQNNENEGSPIKPRMQRKPLSEVLGLTGEAAETFKSIMKTYHETAKAIHGNKDLDQEEKKAALKEAHGIKVEKLQKLLSEKQLAQLRTIWRTNAKPKKNVDFVKLLKLEEEQIKQLEAARHHAIKRKRTILGNKDSSKEEMKKALEEVHKQFLNRRREILTDEQLAQLQEIREKIQEARKSDEQKSGKQSAGVPRPRLALSQTGQTKKKAPQGKPEKE